MKTKKKAAPVLAHRYGSHRKSDKTNLIMKKFLHNVKNQAAGMIVVAAVMGVILCWCGFAEGNLNFFQAAAATGYGIFIGWVTTKWCPEFFK